MPLPDLTAALAALKKGGVIVFPTETFYGVGCRAEDAAACARVAAAKGRAPASPFPVIAADRAQAESLWSGVPDLARRLMDAFWPGPLTLVLPARPGLPVQVAGSGEAGVRVSPHPVPAALARDAGPLVATSANPSGQAEVEDPARLDPELTRRVDVVVDGGRCPGAKPSTVVAVRQGKVVVLREGAIAGKDVHAAARRR